MPAIWALNSLLWIGGLIMAIIGGIAQFNHPIGQLGPGTGALVVFIIGLVLLIVPLFMPGITYSR